MTHTSLSISVCLLLLIKYSRQVQPYVLALCFLAGKLNKKSLLSCAVVVASRELFTTGCALIVERRHHLKDRPRDLLIIGPRPVFFVSFCLFVFSRCFSRKTHKTLTSRLIINSLMNLNNFSVSWPINPCA